MNKLIIILFMVILSSCKTKPSISKKEINEEVKEIIAHQSKHYKRVSYLASDLMKGRNTGSKEIKMAADYIQKELKTAGVKPYFETYFHNIDETDYNVVGMIEGSDANLKSEIVVFGAHYDHIGESKTGSDKIMNGANDNAAGVASVLAMADYFGKNKPKRTVLFALFTAEEKGLLGSKALAKDLKAKNTKIVSMLNMEMIGVPMQKKPESVYLTGFNNSNMAEVINAEMKDDFLTFLAKAKEYDLFRRSDNYPFYQEFNIPAQTISSFDFTNYNYYHHAKDETKELDFDAMALIIDKSIQAASILANTDSSIKLKAN